ncbi:DNA polymerase III subunit alpha [Psychroserpens sp.]|uniref:DNA polymerase III subunit alpha n=1 Tax=Psychroserpens sp. TaxID=2020870 RepID=UPI001B101835|nr:DNA polymerase III subunit alpha [Psychroserpens sp.]MBO6605550.1 DNA polymerase III subunit alpha [Psychroserpens sp.]MBO6630869.1 DNA polymerase III subunit alpha [Psychroserpens sp.]MBO6653641.1 DNA polymerase III subunit alpha [Psychroserpens sp.]MBO6681962.1 DNA polymerase III subunit alpha [Psychroserpens sp.]MBO6748924.1 DNA polymerase III subunit alpha [Psychroserpens sp.]
MYLNCHTYYSLRYGTIAPKKLLAIASENSINTLALTDINNTSACLDFVRISEKYQIKPILGVDFRNGAKQQFILIAKNNQGFQNINTYLSKFLHDEELQIPERPEEDIRDCYVIYPYQKGQSYTLKDNEFLGIKPKDLNALKFSKWHRLQHKLVILKTVSFQNKKGFNTHRLLRAIDNNTLLSKLSKSEEGDVNDMMLPYDQLCNTYQEFPELIENTKALLSRCTINFDFSQQTPNNQESYTNNQKLDFRLLKKLTYQGLHYRYKKPGARIFARIEKELNIIEEKNFVSYFLINWKILKYARSKGYFYVGRGSGANSIVAYLLRITDVDPVELDLYFERFINLFRQNPPDFDIDFSWRDRDDITEFIFKTFKHTALITVYNTFKFRASVRELGKVFGLPKSEMDTLTRGKYDINQLDRLSQLVIKYSTYIEGFPNYLGIHAGGILISERPIHYYGATFMPPKGFATTQFDMVVAEDIGLYKFDILSQRGLGKIKETVEIIRYNHPNKTAVDVHDIKRFKKDERIKDLLKNAKAIGCFYVESPAMRMLLRKLQVDNYLGLVAASSVIRPGVSQSGMMREYILRYRYPERRKDAHPVLLEIMPETYGVMVYQEDVIKVAHHFGGLNLGEADMLRRGMSGKFRSREEFLKVKQRFFDNCKHTGKSEALTKEIWRQIESFAGYAFAKGHSASYAVESYQSLFLKAYFPLEYMTACINNFGGFYRTELYVHEARMHGGRIEPPCVNTSYTQAIIKGKTIFLGFMFLQAFESKTTKRIVEERTKNGPFESLDDFIERVPISVEQITILIKINAFRFTNINKRELLWEAHLKISKTVVEDHIMTLFKTERINYQTPKLSSTALENAFDEIELLSFPLCNPFHLLQTQSTNSMRAKQLTNFEYKTITIEGYLVATKNTKTANRKHMFFGTFLDYDGDFIDTVHFPPVAAKYPFRGNGIYTIKGKVMIEFDCVTIEVSEMQRAAIIEDPRYAVQSKNNTFQNKKSFKDHKAASLTHKVSRTHKTFKP